MARIGYLMLMQQRPQVDTFTIYGGLVSDVFIVEEE
jgi:hypothetical protein